MTSDYQLVPLSRESRLFILGKDHAGEAARICERRQER